MKGWGSFVRYWMIDSIQFSFGCSGDALLLATTLHAHTLHAHTLPALHTLHCLFPHHLPLYPTPTPSDGVFSGTLAGFASQGPMWVMMP